MLPPAVKIVVLIIFVNIFGWHILWELSKEKLLCGDLLTKPDRNSTDWEPTECNFHYYSKKEVKECFKRRIELYGRASMVFMGDSHSRGLYYVMKSMAGSMAQDDKKVHEDLYTNNLPVDGAQITFLWKSFLNETYKNIIKNWGNEFDVPDLLITGSVLHNIVRSSGSAEVKNQFRQDLTRTSALYDRMPTQLPSVWYIQPPTHDDRLRFTRPAATNKNVDDYNRIATDVLEQSNMVLWTSTRTVARYNFSSYQDDVHIGESSKAILIQGILNYYCNQILEMPHDMCCTQTYRYMSPVWSQISGIILFVGSAIVAFWLLQTDHNKTEGTIYSSLIRKDTKHDLTKIHHIKSILEIALMVVIISFMERSPIFSKDLLQIRLPLTILIMVLVCSMNFVVLRTEDPFKPDLELQGLILLVYILLKFNGAHLGWGDDVIKVLEGALLTLFGLQLFQLSSCVNLMLTIIGMNLLPAMFCVILSEPYQNYTIPSLCTLNSLLVIPATLCATTIHMATGENISLIMRKWIIFLGSIFMLYIFKKFNCLSELLYFIETREHTSTSWMESWTANSLSVFAGFGLGLLLHFFETSLQWQSETKISISRAFGFLIGLCFLYYPIWALKRQHSTWLVPPGPLMVYGVYACIGSMKLSYNFKKTVFHYLGEYWLELLVLSQHVLLCKDQQVLLTLISNSITISSILSFLLLFILGDEMYKCLCIFYEK